CDPFLDDSECTGGLTCTEDGCGKVCATDDDCERDGLLCNGEEVCNTGTGFCEVEATALDCNDGVSCTVDTCVEPTVQGNPATCSNTPNDGLCADSNQCTQNICNPASGCEFPPVSCDDGIPCTT